MISINDQSSPRGLTTQIYTKYDKVYLNWIKIKKSGMILKKKSFNFGKKRKEI
jgi:hypothetical protein